MTTENFFAEVNAHLGDFFERKKFLLIEKKYESNRHRTVLRWANDFHVIEMYSDPVGGEVNCRVATRAGGDGLVHEWHFLYEIAPLTPEELREAHTSFRSSSTQLEGIVRKIKKQFDGGS